MREDLPQRSRSSFPPMENLRVHHGIIHWGIALVDGPQLPIAALLGRKRTRGTLREAMRTANVSPMTIAQDASPLSVNKDLAGLTHCLARDALRWAFRFKARPVHLASMSVTLELGLMISSGGFLNAMRRQCRGQWWCLTDVSCEDE